VQHLVSGSGLNPDSKFLGRWIGYAIAASWLLTLGNGASAQTRDELDELGCWQRQRPSPHARGRSFILFCFRKDAQVWGASSDGLHGHDWTVDWSRAGPDTLVIDHQRCAYRLAEGVLRIDDCGSFTGEWTRVDAPG
jgi:hypothetical protein